MSPPFDTTTATPTLSGILETAARMPKPSGPDVLLMTRAVKEKLDAALKACDDFTLVQPDELSAVDRLCGFPFEVYDTFGEVIARKLELIEAGKRVAIVEYGGQVS